MFNLFKSLFFFISTVWLLESSNPCVETCILENCSSTSQRNTGSSQSLGCEEYPPSAEERYSYSTRDISQKILNSVRRLNNLELAKMYNRRKCMASLSDTEPFSLHEPVDIILDGVRNIYKRKAFLQEMARVGSDHKNLSALRHSSHTPYRRVATAWHKSHEPPKEIKAKIRYEYKHAPHVHDQNSHPELVYQDEETHKHHENPDSHHHEQKSDHHIEPDTDRSEHTDLDTTHGPIKSYNIPHQFHSTGFIIVPSHQMLNCKANCHS